MPRYIDADALRKEFSERPPDYYSTSYILDSIDSADAIEELLKENAELENSGRVLMAAFARLKEKVPTWISVEERLPEKHQAVMFYIPWNKNNMIGWIDEGGGINLEGYGKCYDFSLIKPSHWMPLPEPPKEVLPSGEV